MAHPPGTHFDLVVIGGGPAGSIVAEGAVSAGMAVALIERDQLGGTCLNYGCDPTNVMTRAGELLALARTASDLGVTCARLGFDWPVLRAYIARMIDEVRDGDGIESVRAKGVHLYQGHALFVNAHSIEVGGSLLSAERIVVAAGGEPVIPDIQGLAETGYLTSRDIFALETLPRSMVVIGAGSNAMEFAQAYRNFGTRVSLVTTEPCILPQEDTEIAEELTRLLRRDGIDIHTNAKTVQASRTETGDRCLSFTDDTGAMTEVEADALLVAAGQRPAVDGLGLDAADVRFSAAGIDVDTRLRTSVPHIFAIGDVTGIGSHTHVADYQAQVALHNILHPDAPKDADYRVVPWKVFTQPEIGRVGLTEGEARAAGHDVVVASMPYRDLPRAVSLNQRDGFAKLIVDRESHQVLGGHVLGANASEVIAQVALAMQHGLPVTAIRETLHVHPTMSEGVYWAADSIRKMLLRDLAPAP